MFTYVNVGHLKVCNVSTHVTYHSTILLNGDTTMHLVSTL